MNQDKNNEIVFEKIINILFDIQTWNYADHQLLLDYRTSFVDKIYQLKNLCLPLYGQRVTNFIYFSIIYYADEKVFANSSAPDLYLLQEELLGRNDGGSEFFKICSEVINDPSLPLVLYKTLYLIIMNGFLGIYFDDQVYLDQVKQKLKYFICDNDLIINKKNQGSSNPAKVIILKNGFWSQNLHRTMVISTTALMVTSCLSYIGVYAYLIW